MTTTFRPAFRPGDLVRKTQDRPGISKTVCLGQGIVARVVGKRVTLTDGSVWRLADGYKWGCQSTRGVGRGFEPRIDLDGGIELKAVSS